MTISSLARTGQALAAAFLATASSLANLPDSSSILFDELPRQPANGVTVQGITFSSPNAVFNHVLPGPRYMMWNGEIDSHQLVGSTSSSLGIAFAIRPQYFAFTFAFNSFHPNPDAVRIVLYDQNDELIDDSSRWETKPVRDEDGNSDPNAYPVGLASEYTYFDSDVARMEITFNGPANTYAIGEFFAQYTGNPIPESGTGVAGTAMAALALFRLRPRRIASDQSRKPPVKDRANPTK
jgi:hypothetical protein